MSTTAATCREHVWERHLEVRNKIERVIRVCAHCGREEICWEQQRRKGATPGPAVFAQAPPAPGRFGPGPSL